MVNITPRPIYPLEKNTGTLRTGGWVGPTVGLDVLYKKEISCLCVIRTPGCPTRSSVTIQPTLPRFPCNRCTANYTVNKNLNNIISEYCSNMQFVELHLGSYVIFRQIFGKAVMWPDCIYNITELIYCCVLTVFNTLYKFVTTQRDDLCKKKNLLLGLS